MIPFDRWHDCGDGTALVVIPSDVAGWHHVNRPCDTCGGDGTDYGVHRGDDGPGPHGPCPGCQGRKRHTFDIEAGYAHNEGAWRDIRVHVIDVLPIVDNDAHDWVENDDHHIGMGRDEVAEYNGIDLAIGEPKYVTDLSLPPAAEPGMWLVRLAVHS